MFKYFENISEQGVVTIDDARKNYCLKRVFRLSDCEYLGSGATYASYVDAYKYVCEEENEILAIRPTESLTDDNADLYIAGGNGVAFYSFCYQKIGNEYWIFVNKSDSGVYDPTKVYLYLFIEKSIATDKFGLEIFAADGKTVLFHSSDFLLKVLDYSVTSDVSSINGGNFDNHAAFNYDCGTKQVAACFSSMTSTFIGQFYGFFNLALIVTHCCLWWKRNGTLGFYRDVIVDNYAYDYAAVYEWQIFYNTQYSTQMLLIDVTNAPEPL